jgi:hypothetical protein
MRFAAAVLGGAMGCSSRAPVDEAPEAGMDAAFAAGDATDGARDAATEEAAVSPCGDTSSNPDDCGHCGHGCLGGACVGGVCQPVALVPASAGARPFHLAIDEGSVYWTDAMRSSVTRTDKQTGASTTLYRGGFSVDGLAIDGQNVYFADLYNVYRCGLAACEGGAPLALVPEGGAIGVPYFLAAGESDVYWDEQDTMAVRAVAKIGGGLRTLATGPGDAGLAGVAADSQYVYVAGIDGTVVRIPVGGGAAEPLNAGAVSPSAWEIVASAQDIYWSQDDPDDGPGSIHVAGQNGQGLRTFASGQPQPGGLALDGENVYWTNVGANLDFQTGTIVSCPLSGCKAPTVLASGQHLPREIAVDDVAVYWSDYGTGNSDGSVMKVAKP